MKTRIQTTTPPRRARSWFALPGQILTFTTAALLCASSQHAGAVAPVAGQFVPVAVYHDLDHPFGLAYDSAHNLMWYSRGDSGDNLAHSLKPFKAFTAADVAALPVIGGVFQVSPAASHNDVAG